MSKALGFFVTGTDTGIGKTWVALTLIHHLKKRGLTVLAMKPVASGCYWDGNILKNEDAVSLQANASFKVPYELVNPYAYLPPISPHIAAEQAKQPIQFDRILDSFEKLSGLADCIIVEGIGGWKVPLSDDKTVSDLAKLLDLPVISVVGMRLGCLNHALLSFAAIEDSTLQRIGWIANQIDPNFSCLDDNIETLKQRSHTPLLGVLPYIKELDLNKLNEHIEPSLFADFLPKTT